MRLLLVALAAELALLSIFVETSSAQTLSSVNVYTFSEQTGDTPNSIIQAGDGNFYGVAVGGGTSLANNLCAFYGVTPTPTGCGTVFSLTPDGKINPIYNFSYVDGAYPISLIQGSNGDLYGATAFGGSGTCMTSNFGKSIVFGCGTIFRITSTGTLIFHHDFTNEGAYPTGLIQGSDGNFYGTTVGGGAFQMGTVFQIAPDDTTFNVLHSFNGTTDGSSPEGIIQGDDGNFYGVTQSGQFFSITSGGSFTPITTSTPLPEFQKRLTQRKINRKPDIVIPSPRHVIHMGCPDGSDNDFATLLAEGNDHRFYGATPSICLSQTQNQPGTVFGLSASGNVDTVLTFPSQTDGSYLSLLLGSDGNFYGSGNELFEFTSNGTFSVANTEIPNAMIQGSDGNFYVVTGGSLSGDCSSSACGAISVLAPPENLQPPVELSFDAASVGLGSPVTIRWTVANGFSATLQQCYASIQEPFSSGNWTGLQIGQVTSSGYVGSSTFMVGALGTYTYSLTCGGQESGFATLRVLPLTIVTTSLPGGSIGTPYSATLGASYGTPPFSWSVTSGALPAGLQLASGSGIISGTPGGNGGTTSFVVQVTDSEASTASATVQLSIDIAGLNANPASLTVAQPGATGTSTLNLAGFSTNSIAFSCSGLPNEATCSFGALTGTGTSGTVTMQILTTAPSSTFVISIRNSNWSLWASSLLSVAVLIVFLSRVGCWRDLRLYGAALIFGACILLQGCGGSSTKLVNPGTPSGSSTVVVTAKGNGQTANVSLSLTVQ